MNHRTREFGSKATDHRIAQRVARDYTPAAWAADQAASQPAKDPSDQWVADQLSTVKANAGSIETLLQLCLQRTPWVAVADARAWAIAATAEQVAAKVDYLETLPVAAVRENFPSDKAIREVPEGRYAITGNDGATKFYKVDRPTEGRWAGYTFVKVQAGDEMHSLRQKNARLTVLAAIAEAGVEAAMLRYGRELGHCGHCGRTLTNPESLEAGIGPICRGKMGF